MIILENFMQLFGELPSIVEKIDNFCDQYNTDRYNFSQWLGI
jgi:hypothetical protein